MADTFGVGIETPSGKVFREWEEKGFNLRRCFGGGRTVHDDYVCLASSAKDSTGSSM